MCAAATAVFDDHDDVDTGNGNDDDVAGGDFDVKWCVSRDSITNYGTVPPTCNLSQNKTNTC